MGDMEEGKLWVLENCDLSPNEILNCSNRLTAIYIVLMSCHCLSRDRNIYIVRMNNVHVYMYVLQLGSHQQLGLLD